MDKFDLEQFGIWEDVYDKIEDCGQAEEEKFPEAQKFEEIVGKKDDIKEAIQH